MPPTPDQALERDHIRNVSASQETKSRDRAFQTPLIIKKPDRCCSDQDMAMPGRALDDQSTTDQALLQRNNSTGSTSSSTFDWVPPSSLLATIQSRQSSINSVQSPASTRIQVPPSPCSSQNSEVSCSRNAEKSAASHNKDHTEIMPVLHPNSLSSALHLITSLKESPTSPPVDQYPFNAHIGRNSSGNAKQQGMVDGPVMKAKRSSSSSSSNHPRSASMSPTRRRSIQPQSLPYTYARRASAESTHSDSFTNFNPISFFLGRRESLTTLNSLPSLALAVLTSQSANTALLEAVSDCLNIWNNILQKSLDLSENELLSYNSKKETPASLVQLTAPLMLNISKSEPVAPTATATTDNLKTELFELVQAHLNSLIVDRELNYTASAPSRFELWTQSSLIQGNIFLVSTFLQLLRFTLI